MQLSQLIWYDMIWYDLIWYDMIWYDDYDDENDFEGSELLIDFVTGSLASESHGYCRNLS